MNAKNFCLAGVLWTVIFFIVVVLCGCQTPYTGTLGPNDFNGWVESEEDGFVCLWNGFDRICVQSVVGKDGKDGKDGSDGKDGKDGQTLIAIHDVPIEVIVQKIIETVVVEEVIKEVPVEIITERVVTEFIDREVEIEVFVERTVEIIKEVLVEIEVIKEIPVEVEVIKEVPVEVEVIVEIIKEPVKLRLSRKCLLRSSLTDQSLLRLRFEVIKEVPVEVEVIKTVYVEVPAEPEQISVTEGAVYTEADYDNPPERISCSRV